MRRRFVAAWVLMLVVTIAPSLALAAAACAPHCCPASAEMESGETDDCRAALAKRDCCSEAPAPLASFAPAAVDLPSFQAILARAHLGATPLLHAPLRSAEAERALRTSALRLSVVLRI